MHDSSCQAMTALVKKYLDPDTTYRILDVGSYNVNGCYKPLFQNENWSYTGLDIEAGPNVDIVTQHHYQWPLPSEAYDVIVSGQCLEHVEAPWLWVMEVSRVLKRGGLAIIIAPWSCGEHRHPVDCWRILPDGMRYLLSNTAGLEIKEVGRNEKGVYDLGDTWGVAKR